MTIPFHTPLDAAQQAQFGITEPWPLAMADKVRFGEIDMLGHVNNARYLTWFETVRTVYLEWSGLTRYNPATDPRIVIRSGQIHWVKEMIREETYVVTARATAYRNTSFTIASEIWSAGSLRTKFDCVCVTLESDGSARRPLPQSFIQRITELDGARAA